MGSTSSTEQHAIRPRINMVSGGESSGYGILTVRENLWLFARIYGVPNRLIRERTDRMLDVVGLDRQGDAAASATCPPGQRQKMNFCRGFITDPKILFLDEPTLGLDVTAARAHPPVRPPVDEGDARRTLLLTTHYMAEADELCDRLAIVDRGKVLACDTPGQPEAPGAGAPDLRAEPGARGRTAGADAAADSPASTRRRGPRRRRPSS